MGRLHAGDGRLRNPAPPAGAEPGAGGNVMPGARPPRHILDPTFEPPELAHPPQPRLDHAAWVRVVAARRATHLRAIAERLLARGDAAAPLRCELLAPVFRGEGVVPVQLPPALHAVARLADTDLAGEMDPLFRWRRVSQRVTRGLFAASDGTRWLKGLYQDQYPMPFYALRSWAASGADMRFALTPRSAPVLLAYAAQIEQAHGLAPQAPRWLARPTGWLHGEAAELVKQALRKTAALQHHAWQAKGVAFDLLRPIGAQLPAAPPEAVQEAERLRRRIEQVALRRGVSWAQAQFALSNHLPECHPDDTWCRVTLETHAPFHRVDAWMNDAFDLAGHCWVPLHYWPDVSEAVRGYCFDPTWFEPDGRFRHWRRVGGGRSAADATGGVARVAS